MSKSNFFPDAFGSRQTVNISGPGSGSGQATTYTQPFTGQTLVTVMHNLGRIPWVQVLDSNNIVILGLVVHQNVNQFQVQFALPVAGVVLYG